MEINVHRFIPHTRVEGPGERACLWVQGCLLHCPGCAVPWTWPQEGGEVMATSLLADRILNGPQVEGITLLGGEPFLQAAALAELGRTLRQAGLSVVTFTGYWLEDLLHANDTAWSQLLAVTDLLIDGPYRQDLADLSRPWVGSSNQRYHFLSERYRPIANTLHTIPNRLEIKLQSNGVILINGMGDMDVVRKLMAPAVSPAPPNVPR